MISGIGYTSGRGLEQAAGGRTRAAVSSKLRRLTGRGALGRGSYALRQLVRDTGYQPEQLRRAARALNQKWKRLHPKGSFLITEEQRDELIEWLRHDYWASCYRLYCCCRCATDVRPHRSLGLCERCYARYYRRCRRLNLTISPQLQARVLAHLGVADKLPGEVLARMRDGMAADFELLQVIADAIGVDSAD